ncbi:MAG: hypothetical protein WC813_00620 [Patescibacteria group bacterium]|jgi:hypothetical protein
MNLDTSLPATAEIHSGDSAVINHEEIMEACKLLQKIIEIVKSANRVLWVKPEEVTQADREAFALLEVEGIVKIDVENRDNKLALSQFRRAVRRLLQGEDIHIIQEVRIRSLMIELRHRG